MPQCTFQEASNMYAHWWMKILHLKNNDFLRTKKNRFLIKTLCWNLLNYNLVSCFFSLKNIGLLSAQWQCIYDSNPSVVIKTRTPLQLELWGYHKNLIKQSFSCSIQHSKCNLPHLSPYATQHVPNDVLSENLTRVKWMKSLLLVEQKACCEAESPFGMFDMLHFNFQVFP